jgi:thymidine phosphorylase
VRDWAPSDPHITGFACRRFGELAARLGAGRLRQGDTLDLAVGLEVLVRTGDEVAPGAPAVRVHARTDQDAEAVLAELPSVVHTGPEPVAEVPLVLARVGLAKH